VPQAPGTARPDASLEFADETPQEARSAPRTPRAGQRPEAATSATQASEGVTFGTPGTDARPSAGTAAQGAADGARFKVEGNTKAGQGSRAGILGRLGKDKTTPGREYTVEQRAA